MTSPLAVGLVGCGAIGAFRARAIVPGGALRLVAVADQDRARAEDVGRTAGARVHGEPMELAADRDVQAVILSTPPAAHEPLGLAFLQAGKHLLVEKPLATSVEACERLVAAAEQRSLRLATGFTLRHTPATVLARRIVDSGGIGELDRVRAFHGHPGGKDFGPAWITDAAVTGGGTLMDNGIHVIDLARWFLGDVTSSTGFASNHVWRKPGCEDTGFVLMRSPEGKVGSVESSWSEWRGYGWRCEVYGSEGCVRFGFPPLWLTHTRGTPGGPMSTRRHLFPWYQVMERVRGWQWSLVETLRLDQEEWAAAIRDGRAPASSGRDGLEAVRIARSVDLSGVR